MEDATSRPLEAIDPTDEPTAAATTGAPATPTKTPTLEGAEASTSMAATEPTAAPQTPNIRLDGPAATFSLEDAGRDLPPGILRETHYSVAGGGDSGHPCDAQQQEPSVVEFPSTTEWLVQVYTKVCGWAVDEPVQFSVLLPSGEVVDEGTLVATADYIDGAYVAVRYPPELGAPLGIYTMRFSGPSGTVEQPFEVALPVGPRVYVHDDRIVLFQFAPQETVRLYAYEPISTADDPRSSDAFAFSVWNEYVTDDDGQLLIEGFVGGHFRIIGQQSGEVRPTPSDRFHNITSPFAATVFRPTDEEIAGAPDIWSLLPFVDHDAPGERTYDLTIGQSDPLYWRMRWCAIDPDTLSENLSNIAMRFRLNGVAVEWPVLRINSETHERTGWACQRWATIVTDWPTDQPTILEIEYELEEAVDDGRQIYRAGIYRQVVRVQAIRNEEAPAASSTSDSQSGPVIQPFEPPPPEAFESLELNTLPAPDDVKASVPVLPTPSTDTGEGQSGPWIAAHSPNTLEPAPEVGPEFWATLYVDTCGWPTSGEVPVIIEHPNGAMQRDPLFRVDLSQPCTRYIEFLIPPIVLGTYTVQFATYENMRKSIELVAPSGPRLYVFFEGNQGSVSLLLHQFAPQEDVRLYAYRPSTQAATTLELVGWQAFETDGNGQLYIDTRYCTSAICREDPSASPPIFVVVGDTSGEVNEFNQFSSRPKLGERIQVLP